MKNRKMLDIFNLADDKYVSEADPSKKHTRARKFSWTAFWASACCLLLILNLVLIIPVLIKDKDDSILPSQNITPNMNHIKNPTPDNSQDGDGSASTLVGNDRIIAVLDNLLANGNPGGDTLLPPGGATDIITPEISDSLESEQESSDKLEDLGGSLGSTDINDNQVEGISEGDIVKKSDKFVYYLSGTELYVYSINGASSKLECMLPLTGYVYDMIDYITSATERLKDELEKFENEAYENGWEMFLSSDYKTLTILVKTSYFPVTAVVTFDVSRSPAVELKDFKIISGKYVSSRVVNGEMLLFTSYRIYKGYNKENPLSYMPFYTTGNNAYLARDIYFPNDASNTTYLMVTRLDAQGLEVKESSAYLSYSNKVYVSKDNIFLTRSVYTGETEVSVIGYSSPLFTNKGTVKVKGYIKDQYSLDEYNGILRIVTTTTPSRTSASLYCIDLSTMKIAAMVENFAPLGETVRSVRFDKDYAYVCTAVQITDPVFFFDLSDLNNITYTDTGNIVGFSTSLINLGEGYVVGIGVGSSFNSLKIEVYKEVGDTVESIDSYETPLTYYTTNYKAYYIDRERNLIGLPVHVYESGKYYDRYLLLCFTDEALEIVLYSNVGCTTRGTVRGFYQQGFFYAVSDTGIYTYNLGDIDKYFPNYTEESTTQNNTNTESTPVRDKPAW